MKITLQQVQQNVGDIANRNEYTADIIYELLAAYGRSKSAITQLREGHLNQAEDAGAVLQKDLVYFRTFATGTPLEDEVEKLYEDPLTQRYKPRYIIATDLTLLTAKDRVKGTNLAIKLADIDDHLDFFYWWTGDEVVDTKTEAVADRRAADKMNELYVEIEKQNGEAFATNPQFRHELNVFFTRLLFCFFAEDTNIYEDSQFTNSIKTYTQTDGSDLAWFFSELFTSLDTEDKTELKTPFKEFPYVNGSIFNTAKHAIAIPKFSAQARHLILDCGRQNWGEINPDIFGVMFQGVVDPEHRDENGMDYTSVPNIMKVIQPLFLDSLQEEFDKHYDSEKNLWALLNRVQKIKVFDPACGSGNFLIIAYKEMRQLQHAIISRIDELKPAGLGSGIPDNQLINIHNFYGIEIDDFAHELAVLSLFLAKHQMNQEFTKQFGKRLSIIPLIDIPTIVHGNATRMDWQNVCVNMSHTITTAEQSALFEFEGEQSELELHAIAYDEIYLIGNPPYKGSKLQSKSQKSDMEFVFKDRFDKYKVLDYVAIWFYLATQYLAENNKAAFSFVATSSLFQGDIIGILWPYLGNSCEIIYAYRPFKWSNNARNAAGVTVVIAGFTTRGAGRSKFIFDSGIQMQVPTISPYLSAGKEIVIDRRKKPISSLPIVNAGNYTGHAQALTLNEEEYSELVRTYPQSQKFIKKLLGSVEFIRGESRWCLWIDNKDQDEAAQIPEIAERINNVREARTASRDPSANKLAERPHQFRDRKEATSLSVIIPIVSSERRTYIPIGVIDKDTIITNKLISAYNCDLWVFGVLTSIIHMAWVKTITGRLGDSVSYSQEICYNSYPLPNLSDIQKNLLEKSARKILLVRAAYPEKTLAEMYDPDKMPIDLREAHDENDHLVDSLYKKGGFTNNEDRLALLFDLYEQMTIKEKIK